MTGTIANRSVPAATVIPELAYPDVLEATDWLCHVFGFRARPPRISAATAGRSRNRSPTSIPRIGKA